MKINTGGTSPGILLNKLQKLCRAAAALQGMRRISIHKPPTSPAIEPPAAQRRRHQPFKSNAWKISAAGAAFLVNQSCERGRMPGRSERRYLNSFFSFRESQKWRFYCCCKSQKCSSFCPFGAEFLQKLLSFYFYCRLFSCWHQSRTLDFLWILWEQIKN